MITYFVYDTAIGKITIAENDGKIVRVKFGARDSLSLRGGQSPTRQAQRTELTDKAAEQIEEYLAGKRKTFDVPLSAEGTGFQKRVWDALLQIPYGQTRTYGQTAAAAGNPKAARAAGMACNRNPIAVIIPCHRVIGSTGGLTGFGGGLDIKERLLKLEAGDSSLRSE